MRARLLATSVLASLALCNVPLALAEGEAETIESLTASLSDLTCDGKEGKGIGQCISDVLKRIKVIEENFSLAYKAEAAAWKEEHEGDGISEEYVLALKAFNEQMQTKRKAFQEAVRLARKKFFDQQTVVRVQKGEVKTVGSKPLDTAAELEARKQCSEKFASDQDAERTCLRSLLQRKEAVDKRLRPVRERMQYEKDNAVKRQVLPRR